MKLNVVAFALVTLCLLAVPLATAQGKKAGGNAEQEIKTLTDQMAQAQLKGDPSAYEKYYADDAVIIHGTGARFTKAQEIDNLKSGALKYQTYDVHDRDVHVYGDTAVAAVQSRTKGSFMGNPFDADFRATRVWLKRDGNWKVVLFQVTRLAPPSK